MTKLEAAIHNNSLEGVQKAIGSDTLDDISDEIDLAIELDHDNIVQFFIECGHGHSSFDVNEIWEFIGTAVEHRAINTLGYLIEKVE